MSDVDSARDKLKTDMAALQNQFDTAKTTIASEKTQLDAATRTTLASVQDQFDTTKTNLDHFNSEISEARTRLAAIPELQQRQAALETVIKNFVNRSNVTPDTAINIDNIVGRYKNYLATVGLSIPTKGISRPKTLTLRSH